MSRLVILCSTLITLLALSSSTVLAAAGADPLTAGDRAWRTRASGFQQDHVDPGPSRVAVDAYEEAIVRQPGRLEGYWKLLRALYFLGELTSVDAAEQRSVFDRSREVAELALAQLAAQVGANIRPEALTPQTRRDAAHIYYWSAVSWGLWGRTFGPFQAIRQGVAQRIRDGAQLVISLDPTCEGGGGYRLLGRLHLDAPKVPFFTGWVDKKLGLNALEQALAVAPGDRWNQLFLAEALVRFAPTRRDEAISLLRRLSLAQPRPETRVEDSEILGRAIRLLARLEAQS